MEKFYCRVDNPGVSLINTVYYYSLEAKLHFYNLCYVLIEKRPICLYYQVIWPSYVPHINGAIIIIDQNDINYHLLCLQHKTTLVTTYENWCYIQKCTVTMFATLGPIFHMCMYASLQPSFLKISQCFSEVNPIV